MTTPKYAVGQVVGVCAPMNGPPQIIIPKTTVEDILPSDGFIVQMALMFNDPGKAIDGYYYKVADDGGTAFHENCLRPVDDDYELPEEDEILKLGEPS